MNESDSASSGSDPVAAAPAVAPREVKPASTRPEPGAFAVSQDPLLPAADQTSEGSYSPVPAYEHLGDLPPTYGSQSVYLVAYDPSQLFAYWDIDPGIASHVSYGLRVCRGDGEVETEVAINVREAGRYLATDVPGGTYYVELGTTGRAGRWRALGISGQVTLPPAGLAGEVEPKFATLPFHLSFQRLLELIQAAMGQGEGLTAALARLQAGDRHGMESLTETLDSLSQEQLQTLERLLGQQVSAQSGTITSYGGVAGGSALASAGGGSEALSSGAFGTGGASSDAFGSQVSAVRAFGSSPWLAATVSSDGLRSLAAGSFGMSSDTVSSERVTEFFHAMESNLTSLTEMFSVAAASLSSDFLNSESSSSSGRGFL